MALIGGTRLGSYEVIAAIGAGGMGEVYRARDTKLGRDVAIKVILPALAADRERIVRLEREARALAVLNHPAIATLHGLEEFEGRHFLVMEVVEGETLAERLGRGPMTLADALAIGRQIADALEAAHERGIIHRDLKPANVKITPDERVKLLDFGLAKATDADPQSPNSPANSPTISAMGTQAGVILGTASYMSPEQARGFAADHRSDIFSFGVVMYEMLAGRQPFQGETVSDVLASVLVRDVDLHALPADVHPRLIDLVRRCLEKSPRRRWQAIGDVRYELEQIATSPARLPVETAAPSPAAARSIWRRVLPIAVTAVAAASVTTAIAWWWPRPSAAPGPVTRFPIVLQEFQQLTALNRPVLAVSPDGSQLAFTANRQLFIRHMSDLTVRRIFDNPGASLLGSLAFSPDSTQLAFHSTADASLKRISVNGGAPIPICKLALSPSSLTWTDGALFFATDTAIVRVPDTGGTVEQLIALGPGESAHRPQLLPGGDALLYTVATGTGNDRWDRAKVVAQRLGGGTRVTIAEAGSDGLYVPSGHVLYTLGGLLFAIPFDPATLRASGGPVTAIEGIRRGTGPIGSASAQFAVSDTGTLAFLPGPAAASLTAQLYLGLFDMSGRADPLKIPTGPYSLPRISPDGRWIAYGSDDGRDVSIWVYDMKAGGSPRRLTFGGKNVYPIWSADSTRVLFQSDREGDLAIFSQRVDGSVAQRITKPEGKSEHIAHAMSADGRTLLLDVAVDGKYTLHALSLATKTMTQFGGVTSFTHTGAAFSRNGKWVTYAVKATAQSTSIVYVQPFPATGALFQISPNSEDGHHQIWSPDGTRIFYRPGPGVRIVNVGIQTTPTFAIGDIASVSSPFTNAPPSAQRTFDMMPDGKHFLALTASPGADSISGATEVQIVLNWFEDLRRRAPGKAGR